MATYLIGYDLHPTKDETYSDLIAAIKRFGTWWHHLDSTWVIVSDKSAKEIRDGLKPHLYKDDQILVVKSGVEGAWHGFDNNAHKWLKEHL